MNMVWCKSIMGAEKFFIINILNFMEQYSNLKFAIETGNHFKNGMSLKNLIKRLKKITLLGILLLFISSCEKEEPDNNRQNPIFPLNIGNNWHYEGTYYTGDTTSLQLHVFNSYTIDGITGFALSEYKKGQPISLLKNDEEGNLVEYLFNKEKLVHSTTFFKKNVEKGENWIYKAAVYTNGDYSKYTIEETVMTCITTDTIIKSPKGDFHCIGFSSQAEGKQENGDPHNKMFFYLSENVGIIKIIDYEYYNNNFNFLYEMTLTDYSLK